MALPNDAAQTDLQAEPDAMTRLVYEAVRHDDGGRYAVVVENDHSVIPEELRMAEVTFNVTVIGRYTPGLLWLLGCLSYA